MKKILFKICVVIYFLLGIKTIYPQWEKLNTYVQEMPIQILSLAVKGDTIFAGADDGEYTIFRSFDSGMTWTEVNSVSANPLLGIFSVVIIDNIVFIGSPSGIFYSKDWGESWYNTAFNLNNSSSVDAIIKNENRFYIGSGSGIYYSEDLINWIPDNVGLPKDNLHPDWVLTVHSIICIDSILYAGTNDGVYFKNIDSILWNPSNSGIPYVGNDHATAGILEYDENRIVAVINNSMEGTIFVSTDNGSSWSNISNNFPKYTSGYYYGIDALIIKDNYIVVGTDNGIYFSKDEGQNWEAFNDGLPLNPSSGYFHINDIKISDSLLYAGTKVGVYKKSIDEGIWKPIFKSIPLEGHYPYLGVSGNNFFARGIYSGNYPFINFISSDKGKTWLIDTNKVLLNIYSFLPYKDKFYGYGYGVFVSTDHGLSWKEIDSGISRERFRINDLIVTDSIMYAAYGDLYSSDYWMINRGGIYWSIDNGISWTTDKLGPIPIVSIAKSVNTILAREAYYPINSNLSPAYLLPGTAFYKSVDKGIHLINIDSLFPQGVTVTSVKELNSVFFAGTNRGIYTSTDLGNKWVESSNGLPKNNSGDYSLISLMYVNQEIPVLKNYIFAVVNFNRLFLSENNGETWRSVDFNLPEYNLTLKTIAADENSIFVGTDKGIWKLSISQITSVEQEKELYPKNFILEQNYPNPFNPETNIKFHLPNAADISLKVFNTLGQEVVYITRGWYERGSHIITFNAAKLPSGIYYYTLKAGEIIDTKR